jgi:hypothetical protein
MADGNASKWSNALKLVLASVALALFAGAFFAKRWLANAPRDPVSAVIKDSLTAEASTRTKRFNLYQQANSQLEYVSAMCTLIQATGGAAERMLVSVQLSDDLNGSAKEARKAVALRINTEGRSVPSGNLSFAEVGQTRVVCTEPAGCTHSYTIACSVEAIQPPGEVAIEWRLAARATDSAADVRVTDAQIDAPVSLPH